MSILRIKQKLQATFKSNPTTLLELHIHFEENSSNNILKWDEFIKSEEACNIKLSIQDNRTLFQYYDNGAGEIDYTKIIIFLRGSISSKRQEYLMSTFHQLDIQNNGFILGRDFIDLFRLDPFFSHIRDLLLTLGEKWQYKKLSVSDYINYMSCIYTFDDDIEYDTKMKLFLKPTLTYLESLSSSSNNGNNSMSLNTSQTLKSLQQYSSENTASSSFDHPLNSNKNMSTLPTNKIEKSRKTASLSQTDLLTQLRQKIKNISFMTYIQFIRTLHGYDTSKSKYITLQQFIQAIESISLKLSPDILNSIEYYYTDISKRDKIQYYSLIQDIEASISEQRDKLITLIFQKLDKYNTKALLPAQLINAFSPQKHPLVLSGKLSENDYRKEFLDTFDIGQDIDGKVTLYDFKAYYHHLSLYIDADDDFELLLCNLWNISKSDLLSLKIAYVPSLTASSTILSSSSSAQAVLSPRDNPQDSHLIGTHTLSQHAQPCDTTLNMKDMRSSISDLLKATPNFDTFGPNPDTGRLNILNVEPAGKVHTAKRMNREHPANHQESEENALNTTSNLSSNVSNYAEQYYNTMKQRNPLVPSTTPSSTILNTSTHLKPANPGIHHLVTKLIQCIKAPKHRPFTCNGFVEFNKLLYVHDNNHDKYLTLSEFTVAIRAYQINLKDAEIRYIFEYYESKTNKLLYIEDIMTVLRGVLSESRKQLLKTVFQKLDIYNIGLVDASYMISQYHAMSHPEVMSRRMSTDEALSYFLDTFDMSESENGQITENMFLNYYTNISAMIEFDDDFDRLIESVWQLKYDTKSLSININKAESTTYSGTTNSNNRPMNNNNLQSPRGLSGLSSPTLRHVLQDDVSSTQSSPRSVLPQTAENGQIDDQMRICHYGPIDHRKSKANVSAIQTDIYRKSPPGIQMILQQIKKDLLKKGHMAYFFFEQKIRSYRDQMINNMLITLALLKSILYDCDVQLSQNDIRILFDYLDTYHKHGIPYNMILHSIREPLNSTRMKVVKQAYIKLDHLHTGLVDASYMISQYHAMSHPEVMSKRMSTDEALSYFLDTFDMSDSENGQITENMFVNYYTNISATIDIDDYFIVLIQNVWNINHTATTSTTIINGTKVVPKVMSIPPRGSLIAQTAERRAFLQGRSSQALGILPGTIDPYYVPSTPVASGSTLKRAESIPVPSIPIMNIINKIRYTLIENGNLSKFVAFKRKLKISCEKFDNYILHIDFKKVCTTMEIPINDMEIRQVFEYYDTDHDGYVNILNILNTFLIPLNESRYLLVETAYNKLDSKRENIIYCHELAKSYDASRHPDVLSGESTAEAIYKDFVDTFDVGTIETGMVTRQEFIDYYTYFNTILEQSSTYTTQYSSLQDRDNYFKSIIYNTWLYTGDKSNRNQHMTNASKMYPLNSNKFYDEKEVFQTIQSPIHTHIPKKNIESLPSYSADSYDPSQEALSSDLYTNVHIKRVPQGPSRMKALITDSYIYNNNTNNNNNNIGSNQIHMDNSEEGGNIENITDEYFQPRKGYRNHNLSNVTFRDEYTSNSNNNNNNSGTVDGSNNVMKNGLRNSKNSKTVQMVLYDIRNQLHMMTPSQGLKTLIELQRYYKSKETSINTIEIQEFKQGLNSSSINLSSQDIQVLIDQYSVSTVLCQYTRFLQDLRDCMNQKRLEILHQVYASLDPSNSGVLEPSRILQAYHPEYHPDVLHKLRSSEDVYKEFVQTFDVGWTIDGQVTQYEFYMYYQYISLTLHHDDEFEALLYGVWNIDHSIPLTRHRAMISSIHANNTTIRSSQSPARQNWMNSIESTTSKLYGTTFTDASVTSSNEYDDNGFNTRIPYSQKKHTENNQFKHTNHLIFNNQNSSIPISTRRRIFPQTTTSLFT